MRKILAVILSAVMVGSSLAGCSANSWTAGIILTGREDEENISKLSKENRDIVYASLDKVVGKLLEHDVSVLSELTAENGMVIKEKASPKLLEDYCEIFDLASYPGAKQCTIRINNFGGNDYSRIDVRAYWESGKRINVGMLLNDGTIYRLFGIDTGVIQSPVNDLYLKGESVKETLVTTDGALKQIGLMYTTTELEILGISSYDTHEVREHTTKLQKIDQRNVEMRKISYYQIKIGDALVPYERNVFGGYELTGFLGDDLYAIATEAIGKDRTLKMEPKSKAVNPNTGNLEDIFIYSVRPLILDGTVMHAVEIEREGGRDADAWAFTKNADGTWSTLTFDEANKGSNEVDRLLDKEKDEIRAAEKATRGKEAAAK